MPSSPNIPARYSKSSYVTSLAKRAASSSKRASALVKTSNSGRAFTAANGFTGAAAGYGLGFLDGRFDDFPIGTNSVSPSTAIAIGAVAATFVTDSKLAARVAVAASTVAAYQAGEAMGTSMRLKLTPPEDT